MTISLIKYDWRIREKRWATEISKQKSFYFLSFFLPILYLQIVVNSLVHAVPAIANILVVCMVFWLIFSIMGYQLFGGKFWKCINSAGVKYSHTVVPDKATCENTTDAQWVNSKINFDSSFNGFLALFQVVSTTVDNS